VSGIDSKALLPEREFIAGFHAIGEERYHHKHAFHLLMHEGKRAGAGASSSPPRLGLSPQPRLRRRGVALLEGNQDEEEKRKRADQA
jgi:hypothetical protein